MGSIIYGYKGCISKMKHITKYCKSVTKEMMEFKVGILISSINIRTYKMSQIKGNSNLPLRNCNPIKTTFVVCRNVVFMFMFMYDKFQNCFIVGHILNNFTFT